jgi:hypothetical protein
MNWSVQAACGTCFRESFSAILNKAAADATLSAIMRTWQQLFGAVTEYKGCFSNCVRDASLRLIKTGFYMTIAWRARLPVVAALFFCTATAACAQHARFRRVLAKWRQNAYCSEDRNSRLNLGYAKRRLPPAIDAHLDTSHYLHKNMYAQGAYDKSVFSGDSLYASAQRRLINMEIGRNVRIYTLKGYKTSRDKIDTSEIFTGGQRFEEIDTLTFRARLSGARAAEYRWRLYRQDRASPLYAEIGAGGFAALDYHKEERIEPFFESLKLPEKFFRYKYTAHATGDFAPGLGAGWPRNITYIYYAFEVEKELLEREVINFTLSDETLLGIAAFFAMRDTRHLRQHDSLQTALEDLAAIIMTDEAVEKKNIGFVSPFALQRIALRDPKVYFAGPRFSLSLHDRIGADIMRIEAFYPYDSFGSFPDSSENVLVDEYDDTTAVRASVRHQAAALARLHWGLAAARWLFFEAVFEKRLAYFDAGLSWLEEESLWWKQIAGINISASMHMRLRPWLIATIGLRNVPSWGIVPANLPYASFAELSFFLEEYITIDARLTHFESEKGNRWYARWHSPRGLFSGTQFQFSIIHGF